jgi:hypothetical protein
MKNIDNGYENKCQYYTFLIHAESYSGTQLCSNLVAGGNKTIRAMAAKFKCDNIFLIMM